MLNFDEKNDVETKNRSQKGEDKLGGQNDLTEKEVETLFFAAKLKSQILISRTLS